MATPGDIRNIKEAQAELKKLNDEYRKLTGKKLFDIPTQDFELAKNQIKVFEQTVKSARREAAGLGDIFTDLNSQLKANVGELDKASNSINTGKRAYRDLVRNVRELADEEAGIGKISFANLKKIKQRNDSSLREMKLAAERLMLEKSINSSKDKGFRDLAENEQALIRAKESGFEAESRAIRFTEYRLDLERKVLDSVKLTGGALKGIGNLASSLGLSGFAESLTEIQDDLDNKLRKKIRGAAQEEFAKTNKNYATSLKFIEKMKNKTEELSDNELKRLKYAEKIVEDNEENVQSIFSQIKGVKTLNEKFEALGKAAIEFGKQLKDPLVILGSMLKGYLALDKAATDFQRTTGQNARALAGMNSNLVTSEETLSLMSQFAQETNMNLNNLLTSQQVGRLAETAKMLGLSAEESGKLAQNVLFAGGSADDFTDGVFEAAKAVNIARGEGTNLGSVIKEASSISADLALSLDSNPKAIGRAVIEAQRLGLTLDKIAGIADSMLDFESSIQAELEAQLLTGRNINLSRAREAALMNDMGTLAQEISKAGGIAEDFTRGSRVEQNALAKALGMSREDLAKMVGLEKLRAGTLSDVEAQMIGMSKEQLMQIDAQEKFQTAIAKLQQSLGPLIDAFIPLLDLLLVPVQYLGQMVSYVTQLGPAIREAFNTSSFKPFVEFFDSMTEGLKKLMDGPLGNLIKLLGGLAGGVITFKVGAALAAWATRGTFFNPMVTVGALGGGLKKGGASMSKQIITFFRNPKLFMRAMGRFNRFGRFLSKTLPGLSKAFGPFVKIIGKGSIIFSALLVAVEAVKNFFEFGFIKGIEKTLRDNAGTILGTVVGALLAPFTGGLSLIIGPAIGAILDYFDIFGLQKNNSDLSRSQYLKERKSTLASTAQSMRVNDFTIKTNPQDSLVMAGGTQFGKETNDLLKELISEISNIKGDVYIDGNKTGQAIFASSTNLS